MTLFLDACIIIYWVEASEPFYSRLIRFLKEMQKKNPRTDFAVSRLSILECLVKPLRDEDEDLLRLYSDFFSMSDLKIIELDPSVIELATQLRARHRLRTPDAIQAASALSLGRKILFLTGDPKFKKVPGLSIKIL